MRRLLLIVPLLLAGSVSGAAARDGGSAWLQPTSVSGPVPTLWGLQVGLADNGDTVAVWVEGGQTRVIRAAIRPAGRKWERPQSLTPPGPETGFPDLAVDPEGNAIAVWKAGADQQDVVQASLRPAGGRFGAPHTVAHAAQSAVSTFGPPRVAVDPRGHAIAVWAGGSYGSTTVQYAEGTSRRGFGTPRDLARGDSPDVAVDGEGNATVAWAGPSGIESARRPAGRSFGKPQALGRGGYPEIAVNARGDAVVGWSVERIPPAANATVQAAFAPSGKRFGPAELVGQAGDGGYGVRAGLDEAGDATVLWISDRYATSPLQAAVRPVGGHFAGSQLLSPDVDSSSLAISRRQGAIAIWSRYAGDYLAQVATLGRGRALFGAPRAVSEPGYNALDPAIAADAAGNAVAAWQGSQGRNFVVEAAGYDGAGPQLRALHIPTRGKVGVPLRFSVSPLDVWSDLSSTSWSFGDGENVGSEGGGAFHAYRKPGRYTVEVIARDTLGHATSTSRTVRITR